MRFLISCLFIITLVFTPVQPANAQKEHVKFFKQFNKALETGDDAAATEVGERAWRTAEEELGDNQTTAILAYNYAAHIYAVTPEQAIEPLERAIAIVGEGSGLFGAEPPALMLAFVRAVANDDDKKMKSGLRDRLEAFDTQNEDLTLLSGRGWLHVTRYEMDRKRYSQADDAATAALRHFAAFRELSPREYVNALLARGISKVAGSQRSNDDLIDANIDFTEAIEMFPPQQDIESFDPLLAAAVAWNAAVRSAAASDNPGRAQLGSRFRRDPPELDGIAYVKWAEPNPLYLDCEFQWAKRDAPRFPASASNRGYLGAVLVGYHIDGVKVAEARILAHARDYLLKAETAVVLLPSAKQQSL